MSLFGCVFGFAWCLLLFENMPGAPCRSREQNLTASERCKRCCLAGVGVPGTEQACGWHILPSVLCRAPPRCTVPGWAPAEARAWADGDTRCPVMTSCHRRTLSCVPVKSLAGEDGGGAWRGSLEGGRRARDDKRPITCGQVVPRLRGGAAGLSSRSEVSKAESVVMEERRGVGVFRSPRGRRPRWAPLDGS